MSQTDTVKIWGELLRSAVLLEELQYTDDDVIDIAKPRGLHQHKNQKRHLTQMSWTEKTHINTCGFVLTSNFLAWCKPPAQFIAMSQIWKIKQSQHQLELTPLTDHEAEDHDSFKGWKAKQEIRNVFDE